jgi:phage tail-like protein
MVAGAFVDPYASYNFLVEIDGITRGAFQEVSGVEATVEAIEYRQGGENFTVRKLPGMTSFSNIVLKWGITDDMELYRWHQDTVNGVPDFRKNGSSLYSDIVLPTATWYEKHDISVIVDRLSVKPSAHGRLTDSVETALKLAGGTIVLDFVDRPADDPERERVFSEHLYCPFDDLSFEQLEPRSFSFNAPYGACPDCTGLGVKQEVDPELVVPNPGATLAEGARAWRGGHLARHCRNHRHPGLEGRPEARDCSRRVGFHRSRRRSSPGWLPGMCTPA